MDLLARWAISDAISGAAEGEAHLVTVRRVGAHARAFAHEVEVVRASDYDGAVGTALDAMEADAQRRLDAGDAPMVAAADLDALARVRRLHERE